MNPEAIIERSTCRPFVGAETIRNLRAAGWYLIHVEHEEYEEDVTPWAPAMRTSFKIIVWGEKEDRVVLDRTLRTMHQILKYAHNPEAILKQRRAQAWHDLALPLGKALGVIEE